MDYIQIDDEGHKLLQEIQDQMSATASLIDDLASQQAKHKKRFWDIVAAYATEENYHRGGHYQYDPETRRAYFIEEDSWRKLRGRFPEKADG